jgi:hypothetical protein
MHPVAKVDEAGAQPVDRDQVAFGPGKLTPQLTLPGVLLGTVLHILGVDPHRV